MLAHRHEALPFTDARDGNKALQGQFLGLPGRQLSCEKTLSRHEGRMGCHVVRVTFGPGPTTEHELDTDTSAPLGSTAFGRQNRCCGHFSPR